MDDLTKKAIADMRSKLVGTDLSHGDLLEMQLRVDTLVKLAAMDAGHDHDTQGGVGHHDHTALADLSWLLDPKVAAASRKSEG